MRIEEDIKLDFKDVLIRPKRSILRSRNDVDLVRKYKFLHSKNEWSGVPIIAANMDHTGTFGMAKILSGHQLLTAISKFATIQEWQEFNKDYSEFNEYVFVSSGSRDGDFKNLCDVMQVVDYNNICLDIANGYSQHFVDFV